MAGDTLHEYRARIAWLGAGAAGTGSYTGYERTWRAEIDGKPALTGSADSAFRGDPAAWNPEDCLLAAVSACHMLFFLALCARGGVRVLAYRDAARAELALTRDGGGALCGIALHAHVRLADGADAAGARALFARAGELCFVARSLNTPVAHAIEFESDSPA
jgi:organic hydroperoxide reductase OsmC/OhrA